MINTENETTPSYFGTESFKKHIYFYKKEQNQYDERTRVQARGEHERKRTDVLCLNLDGCSKSQSTRRQHHHPALSSSLSNCEAHWDSDLKTGKEMDMTICVAQGVWHWGETELWVGFCAFHKDRNSQELGCYSKCPLLWEGYQESQGGSWKKAAVIIYCSLTCHNSLAPDIRGVGLWGVSGHLKRALNSEPVETEVWPPVKGFELTWLPSTVMSDWRMTSGQDEQMECGVKVQK